MANSFRILDAWLSDYEEGKKEKEEGKERGGGQGQAYISSPVYLGWLLITGLPTLTFLASQTLCCLAQPCSHPKLKYLAAERLFVYLLLKASQQ